MDDLEFSCSQAEQRETIERLACLVRLAEERDSELDRISADIVEQVNLTLATARTRLSTLERCCTQYRKLSTRLARERKLRRVMRRHRLTRDQGIEFLRQQNATLVDSVPSLSSERRAALRAALDNLSKPPPRNGFRMLRLLIDRLQHAVADVHDIA